RPAVRGRPAARRPAGGAAGRPVRAVRDGNDAWAPRHSEAGREALIRGVESYFAEVPPARRWHAREELALTLAEYALTDEEAAALVRAAVWPELAVVLT